MPQTISVADMKIGDYILSVTSRDCGDEPKHLEELTMRTIGAWLYIVKLLEAENYVFKGDSVEQRYADEINKANQDTDGPKTEPFQFHETFGDSRVTVWSTYRGAKNPQFHLNSDDVPQVAIDTWRANKIGIQRALDKLPKGSQPIQDSAHQAQQQFDALPSMNAPQKPLTPNSAHPQGVVVATRAPNPNTPSYSHGQLVSYSINKIEIGTNNGSVVYKFWGVLGSRYALLSCYMKKADGTLSPTYEALQPSLEPLGLSLEKPSVNGNWQVIAQANHLTKDNVTKEYMNIQSIVAI